MITDHIKYFDFIILFYKNLKFVHIKISFVQKSLVSFEVIAFYLAKMYYFYWYCSGPGAVADPEGGRGPRPPSLKKSWGKGSFWPLQGTYSVQLSIWPHQFGKSTSATAVLHQSTLMDSHRTLVPGHKP